MPTTLKNPAALANDGVTARVRTLQSTIVALVDDAPMDWREDLASLGFVLPATQVEAEQSDDWQKLRTNLASAFAACAPKGYGARVKVTVDHEIGVTFYARRKRA